MHCAQQSNDNNTQPAICIPLGADLADEAIRIDDQPDRLPSGYPTKPLPDESFQPRTCDSCERLPQIRTDLDYLAERVAHHQRQATPTPAPGLLGRLFGAPQYAKSNVAATILVLVVSVGAYLAITETPAASTFWAVVIAPIVAAAVHYIFKRE